MIDKLAPYWKGIVAALIAVAIIALTAFDVAFTDGVVTSQEWITIALAVLGAIGVYFVPNRTT